MLLRCRARGAEVPRMLQRKPRPCDLIAKNLLIAWSDVVTEPLPGRIHRLLERLANEESERRRGTATSKRCALASRAQPHPHAGRRVRSFPSEACRRVLVSER